MKKYILMTMCLFCSISCTFMEGKKNEIKTTFHESREDYKHKENRESDIDKVVSDIMQNERNGMNVDGLIHDFKMNITQKAQRLYGDDFLKIRPGRYMSFDFLNKEMKAANKDDKDIYIRVNPLLPEEINFTPFVVKYNRNIDFLLLAE
ncbi:hypothetical protein [Akkermansia muciniphila]|nr:hypothetical protein [Akkermansia muciniphila]